MPKIDKSLYTKDQYKALKAAAKALKSQINKNSKPTTLITIQEHQQSTIPIAFVLGNGTSRNNISPNELQMLGKVYGCNALYRSFAPDCLIAVDTKMIVEINKTEYQKSNAVWTNPNKLYSSMEGFNFFQPSKGWSSGPTALWLASQQEYQIIYILGFDFKGTDSNNFNNIYSDTENYKKSNDTATYYGNWLRQTKTVIEQHNTKIKYVRVIAPDNFIPSELNKISNLTHITTDMFKKMYSLL
jgi:hypothetical protein|tara:strand:+ start:898 stop:1626 length:729 start_codon:yes stop_codon:yes gene_type:complete